MKLILTSRGLSTKKLGRAFIGLLERNASESRVLVVHTAQKQEHLLFVDGVGKELSRNGVLLPNINYVNIAGTQPPTSLAEFDAVYICGGNTYFILDRMRKTGLAGSLKRYVRAGGIYLGISAGSIIAGKDISIAGWGIEGDSNDVGLTDLQGLNFTDIAVFPHYKDKLKREVREFMQTVQYPVEVLRDGEALMINGNNHKKIVR